MDKKFDILTFGEALLRLSPANFSRLSSPGLLQKDAAGSELNVAAGLSQLGLKTAFLTKVPDTPLSRFVLGEGKKSGVSEEMVIFDKSPAARLGIYYYEGASAPRKPVVVYDRKNSSFCSLSASELPKEIAQSTKLFHTSGITLGLSENIRKLSLNLLQRFKESGVLCSFDVNFRANLWSDVEARNAIEPLLPLFDILFVSEESLRRMFGQKGELSEILPHFSKEYGVSYLLTSSRGVLSPTRHTFTCFGYDQKNKELFTEPFYTIDVVDRIGSGDAFASGALYALLTTGNIANAVRFGNAMAALKSTIPGDLPCTNLSEVEKLIFAHQNEDLSEMER